MIDLCGLRRKRIIKKLENITGCDILNLRRASSDIKDKYAINIDEKIVSNFVDNYENLELNSNMNVADNLTTMCVKRLKELDLMRDYPYINNYKTWLDMITLSDVMLFELLPLQILLNMEYKYDTIGIKDEEEYIAFDYLRTLANYYLQITEPIVSENKKIHVKIKTLKQS